MADWTERNTDRWKDNVFKLRISGADTAPNLMGRISLRKGWLVRGEKFFEDRLG